MDRPVVLKVRGIIYDPLSIRRFVNIANVLQPLLMRNRFSAVVILLIFPRCLCDCVQDSSDVIVLDCILERYDVSKLPEPEPTVNVSMFVESIASSEETSLDYSFNIRLTHHYIDERLQYDPGNNSALRGRLKTVGYDAAARLGFIGE